jgi:hypothetical protein
MLSAAHFSDRIPTNFVDCEDAPYDLRPVVEAVIAAENWLLARLPPDQKIVFLLNEAHTDEMSVLSQMAILNAHYVQKRKNPVMNFGYGFEAPHVFKVKDGVPHLKDAIIEGAEMTEEVIRFTRRKKISMRFNDASLIVLPHFFKVPCLDPADKLTQGLMIKRAGFASPLFTAGDADGMAIRNDAIVHNAIKHMERIGARIYLQQCGTAYSFGAKNNAYEDSLFVKFKEKGFAVVPVFPQTFDVNPDHLRRNVPQDILKDCILVSGMAKSDSRGGRFACTRDLVLAASGPNIF